MADYRDAAHVDDLGEAAGRRRFHYDPGRGRGTDAFDAARRHSSRVRWVKIVLPVLALVAVAVFWGSAQFIPTDLATIARLSGIDAASESIVMEKPHISGFEGTRQAYDVMADRAVQSLNDPKVVTFDDIDAHIGLDAAGTASLDASTGVYDGNHNTLVLTEGIATTTDGYWASFRQAAIDLGEGSLVSEGPIEIRTSEGTIRANGLQVSERGKRITFLNGVSVTYLPPGELAAARPVP
jgi:lipopolysaccharide export system protein LptC